MEPGQKQFSPRCKIISYFKRTQIRLFQVFYVHVQSEEAGGGSAHGMCIQTTAPSAALTWNGNWAGLHWGEGREGAWGRYRWRSPTWGVWVWAAEAHQMPELLWLMDPNGANSAHTKAGTSCRAGWTVLVGDSVQSPTHFDFILDQQWFLHDCSSSAWFLIPCWNYSAVEVAEPKMASLLGHPCLFVCLFFPFLYCLK